MNFLRRAIAVQPLLSAHSSRKRLLVLYPVSLLHHSSLHSTSRTATTYTTTKYKYTPKRSKTKPPEQPPSPSSSPLPVSDSDVVVEKKPVDWARPREIPYQAKVANSVNLIGHVQIPVQFKATADGNYWAGTIIAQQQSSQPLSPPPFWIPVVFEGDLAHIANCHLKEKDYVYIAGELCVDQPPLTLSRGQANVQVMAHSLNFVVVSSQSTKSSVSQTADLLSIQSQKLKAPKSSEPISLDRKETFENVHQKKTSHSDGDLWKDLVDNPDKWLDNRSKKVSERSPDFKHKETGKALWLSDSPPWLSFSLPPLEAKQTSLPPLKAKQNDAGDQDGDPWKDLVENPNKWWDNRSSKLNAKAPDFRHKDTSKGLWLSDAPAWALPDLPPLKVKGTDAGAYQKKQKESDAGDVGGDPWKDLVENPKKWWDNRSKKVSERSPDFKHKETSQVLWLNRAPQWALSRLPPLKSEIKTWGAETI